jgi:hypothetical protein
MEFRELAWFLAAISTGVAAGAMTGHALLLGRFFNWVFESDKTEMFRLSYPVFVQARKPQLFFDNLFTAALLVTTAYNVVLWLAGQICALPLLAAGFQWLFVLAFLGTGFAALEGELLAKGNISPERARRFLSLNTRMTALFAILLLGSFSCLVLMKVYATHPGCH